MKTKIISILLCIVFVVATFSGCNNNSTGNNSTNSNIGSNDNTNHNGQSSKEHNTNSTGANSNSSNGATNTDIEFPDDTTNNKGTQGGSSSGQSNQNPNGTADTPNGTIAGDSRLFGVWNASSEIPITEDGKTVTSQCLIKFNEDGTFEQVTTEAQARRMIIDTYLITFNCKNEQELDSYIRANKGTTLEGYVIIALAQMSASDFRIKGTWKTENDNTLYETTVDGNKNNIEVIKYIVSNDKNAVRFTIEDGTGGTTTMTLTKA